VVLVLVAATLGLLGDSWPGVGPVAAAVLLLTPGWGLSRWWAPSRDSVVNYGFAFLAGAIAADVLVACLLTLSPLGLDRSTVTIGYAALSLLTLLTAPTRVEPVAGLRRPARPAATVVRVLVGLLACAAVAAAVHAAPDSRTASEAQMDVTALSVTPDGSSARVTLEPDRAGTYRMVVTLGTQVLVDRTDRLRDQQDLTVSVPTPAAGATLTAQVYRTPDTEVLRRVDLVGSP
jgi:hypothetical protein